jgi:hypothetical protein
MVKGGIKIMTAAGEIVEKIDKRLERGKVIALENKIYRIIGSDVFYVESQSVEDMVYYIMFNTEKEFEWCSCKSFEYYNQKCKHLYAIEHAIRKGNVIDTNRLPKNVKRL